MKKEKKVIKKEKQRKQKDWEIMLREIGRKKERKTKQRPNKHTKKERKKMKDRKKINCFSDHRIEVPFSYVQTVN